MSTVPKKQKKGRGKRLLKFLGILAGGIIAFFLGSNWLVLRTGNGHIFEDVSQLPHHRVGIVLGCSPRFAFFTGRMDAAAQLYREGKVERLLVTGDNMNQGYNEPAEMMKALVKRGIPKEHITADYAGFRTLDSMVRAHEVFGLTEGTVITDDFHLARSIYYAQHAGLEVDGFGSVAAENPNSKQVELREILARGRAVLDILIDKQPKFLGKREIIP